MPSRVIILGGGVAGMTAAHELIERGFEVVVLESGDIAGGKARSIPVIHKGEDTSGVELRGSAAGRSCHCGSGVDLFRCFAGSYKRVIARLRCIPSFGGAIVADHRSPATRREFTQ